MEWIKEWADSETARAYKRDIGEFVSTVTSEIKSTTAPLINSSKHGGSEKEKSEHNNLTEQGESQSSSSVFQGVAAVGAYMKSASAQITSTLDSHLYGPEDSSDSTPPDSPHLESDTSPSDSAAAKARILRLLNSTGRDEEGALDWGSSDSEGETEHASSAPDPAHPLTAAGTPTARPPDQHTYSPVPLKEPFTPAHDGEWVAVDKSQESEKK